MVRKNYFTFSTTTQFYFIKNFMYLEQDMMNQITNNTKVIQTSLTSNSNVKLGKLLRFDALLTVT